MQPAIANTYFKGSEGMNIFKDNLYFPRLIFVGLLLGFWSISSFAQEVVGTVLTSSGNAIAEPVSGSARLLSRGAPIFTGDTVVVAENSRVRFKLLDDSTYVVQENSSFVIEEFYYSGAEDGNEVADFYFSEGVMEFISGHIGKQDPSKFRIDTDFAVIGLRGSGGIISTDSESTRVFVTLGELTARSRTGDSLILNNGQTTVIGQSGESSREQGNSTGAPQTMTTDGDDIVSNNPSDQQDQEAVNEAEEEVAAEEPEEQNGPDGDAEQTTAQSDADGDSQNATVDAGVSAAELYAELLPNPAEATQEDLQAALNSAIARNPVLYAELVTIAIDMGLEPPNAAVAATQALGGSNMTEDIAANIFFVTTEGISDTAEIEAAILSADINATPLVANATETSRIDVNIGTRSTAPRPTNSATLPRNSASPAR